MATKTKKAGGKKATKKTTKARKPRGAAAIAVVEDGPVVAEVVSPGLPVTVASPEPDNAGGVVVKLSAKAVKTIRAALGESPSLLSSAAAVLQAVGVAMRPAAIVEELARTDLWVSPHGKTPAATLGAAILTEIKKKDEASRFVKVGPGLFAAVGSATY